LQQIVWEYGITAPIINIPLGLECTTFDIYFHHSDGIWLWCHSKKYMLVARSPFGVRLCHDATGGRRQTFTSDAQPGGTSISEDTDRLTPTLWL